LRKISRPVRANQQRKSQRNIGRIRKPRQQPRQLRPPHRLQRLHHPRLRPKRSALTNKPRLQQQQVQPRHLQLPPRENTPTQRPALQQWQVLRHQHHQLNSTSAICSNRRIRRQQPVPRRQRQPQLKARALRQQRKRPRLAEATARFGLTPRHTFFTRKARGSTALQKKGNT